MSGGAEREAFVEVGDVRLRAVLEGSTPSNSESVLVLHGFTGAAESMSGVSASLCGDRCVARLELLGHGGSDAPDAVAPYAMAACADQIAEAARVLGLGRPHLLGYSMGGRAALAAALSHPDSFSSLVLVGASAGIADAALRAERIESDEALADRIEREGMTAFVDHWMALPIFATQSRLGTRAQMQARTQRLRNQPHGLAGSLRGMGAGAQAPLHDRLDRFIRPVLLVVGREDSKFRRVASSIEGGLKDARTELIDGAGHAVHLEAPESFARVVGRFIAAIEADREGGRPFASLPRSEWNARVNENGGDPA